MTGHNRSDITPEVAELIAHRHLGSEQELASHMDTKGSCFAHAYTLLGRFGHEPAWRETLAKVTDSKTEETGGREAVNLATIAEGLWLLRHNEVFTPLVAHRAALKAERERLQREQHTSVPTFAPAFG